MAVDFALTHLSLFPHYNDRAAAGRGTLSCQFASEFGATFTPPVPVVGKLDLLAAPEVRRVMVKLVGKVDLWAHVLRAAPRLARAELRLGPRGSAKRILEDAGCAAQKSSVAGNHFSLGSSKAFPGALQPSNRPQKLI